MLQAAAIVKGRAFRLWDSHLGVRREYYAEGRSIMRFRGNEAHARRKNTTKSAKDGVAAAGAAGEPVMADRCGGPVQGALPPEVRESLAELELELSEGESRNGSAWRDDWDLYH
ncbi:hypothetical protein NDU88_004649 [Pleurodeles waltl]|uniref:Uncharacterized protein n=1 Tax=Pleurodeles waltl TaxID=8319 RepID=A0AAV7UJP1_PLEWA|nr:hypothetical protein NDU88_004649 [Pleurodeles waltl]